MAQTLLYTVGSAVLLAGLVLLVALFLEPPPTLLVYFFGLGIAVISLIFIRLQRSSQATMVVQLVGTAVGFAGITAAWNMGDVAPIMAFPLATLLVGLTALSARVINSPHLVMWLAGIAVGIDLLSALAFTSALVGVLALMATIGRGWPRVRIGLAAAAAVSGLQGLVSPDVTWQLVWLISSVLMALWLVHFHKATPIGPPEGGSRQVPTRGAEPGSAGRSAMGHRPHRPACGLAGVVLPP